ncbi:MaoC family dehydratase [Thermodesulfobacteriota bacterium]
MYYEDFELEKPITTRGRVLTGTDIDLFTAVTHAVNPLFLSDETARGAGLPARIAPGPLLFSMNIGLCYQAGLYDHIVAMAGVDAMKFLAPVHPGDTITAVATPVEKRATKKSDRGLVVLRHELKGPKGKAVLTADVTYLMRTREGV